MPRVSFSTDYLSLSNCFDGYYQTPSLVTRGSGDDEQSSTLSPNDIDEILSRKLYDQLKTTSRLEKELNSKHKSEFNVNPSLTSVFNSPTTALIDPELIVLIDRFYNLTYLNTIPMVNLLATAVAINFLKENIRELDKKLQEQQATNISVNIKRGTSLLYEPENDEDDDNISWASAPT